MIDTHAHLGFPQLHAQLQGVIERAEQAGVNQIIVPGTTLQDSEEAIELARQLPTVFAGVGMHPTDALEYTPEVKQGFMQLLQANQDIVSVGEVGLDFYHFEDQNDPQEIEEFKQKQHALFVDMIGLARDFQKPLIVHSREAFEATRAVLELEAKGIPTVLHCFVGDQDQAKVYLEMGCLLSFTAIITYKKNEALREVVKSVPLERIMTETDAPFLPPEGFRGEICEPKYVRQVVECIAEIKGISVEEVDRVTTENATQFFGLREKSPLG